jgi:plasmid stabilization system protein ParE
VTPRVSFRPQAGAEVRAAKAWYDQHVPGLGQDFVRTLDAAVAAIAERPEAFRKVYGEFRQCVMRRFPYSIFFRISPSAIVVIAVHHQSRDPARWQKRERSK